MTASSNKLLITASRISRGYKVFGRAEHENCPFKFHIGRKRGGDGNTLVVKNMVALHKEKRRESKAKDGRKWKTRRAGKYNTVIRRIRQHKDKPPSAGDVKPSAIINCGISMQYKYNCNVTFFYKIILQLFV